MTMPKIPNLDKLTPEEREKLAAELVKEAEEHEKKAEEIAKQIEALREEYGKHTDRAYYLRRLAHQVRTYPGPAPS